MFFYPFTYKIFFGNIAARQPKVLLRTWCVCVFEDCNVFFTITLYNRLIEATLSDIPLIVPSDFFRKDFVVLVRSHIVLRATFSCPHQHYEFFPRGTVHFLWLSPIPLGIKRRSHIDDEDLKWWIGFAEADLSFVRFSSSLNCISLQSSSRERQQCFQIRKKLKRLVLSGSYETQKNIPTADKYLIQSRIDFFRSVSSCHLQLIIFSTYFKQIIGWIG